MRKVVITLLFIIAVFSISAQNDIKRHLKIETSEGEYEILNLSAGVQYTVRAEADANNTLVVRIYDDSDNLLGEYPATAVVYPIEEEYEEDFLEMVDVEGGTYTRGCTAEQGDDCYDWEKPAHEVTLSSFRIGKYPVTQEQWFEVMGTNPSYFEGDNLPVESVSWNMIAGTEGASMEIKGITYYEDGFIYQLNQITGKEYRLPTEAEWEYAARGDNQSQVYKYSGSNNVDDVAWYWDNIPSQTEGEPGFGTQPVGTKQPNELGIYDMSGNVWEWCADWWSDYTDEALTDPAGPATGSYRVLRGGSWYDNAALARVSYRDHNFPGSINYYFGFRLACSSE